MAHYLDLQPCDYFGRWQDVLLAVGWLEATAPFWTGPVRREFFSKLVDLLAEPWQPAISAGHHRCGLCRFTGGPAALCFEGRSVQLGVTNLFVPGEDRVYVAPSLIAHYMDAHGYGPPPAFVRAVLACPEMGTLAYLEALKARGMNPADALKARPARG